jgi:hypothetical protein
MPARRRRATIAGASAALLLIDPLRFEEDPET